MWKKNTKEGSIFASNSIGKDGRKRKRNMLKLLKHNGHRELPEKTNSINWNMFLKDWILYSITEIECFLSGWIRNIYKKQPSHKLQQGSQKYSRCWGTEETSFEEPQNRMDMAHMDVTLFICKYLYTNINSLLVIMAPSASPEALTNSTAKLSPQAGIADFSFHILHEM